MRYFRKVDEGYHAPGADWGDPTYWFEVNAAGHAERQVVDYPNGNVLSYDRTHEEDEYGALGVMVIDGDEDWWEPYEITRAEFEAKWQGHTAMNRRDSHSKGIVMGAAPEGFSYVPDFLSPDEHVALLGQLRGLNYQHDTFRGQRLKRAYAQFGYAYVSTGRQLTPAAPLPDFLTALIEKARSHYPEGSEFNQCTRKGRALAGTRMLLGLANASWPSVWVPKRPYSFGPTSLRRSAAKS